MRHDPSSRWHRKGLLVPVKAGHPWWRSHAQLPTILPISERLWRIYFAARDSENRSRILAVDVDPGDDMRVVEEYFEPLLDLGPPGAFDHAGVGPATAVAADGEIRLYYGGLLLRRDVPGQVMIGVAVSDDGLTFRRAFAGPVHGLGPFDPFFSSAATVLKTADGYRMWYVGGTQWSKLNGQFELSYEIRTTRSDDGLIWDPRSETAVALASPGEAGLGRPWVTNTAHGRRLWLSIRGQAYRGPGPGAYQMASIAADSGGSFSGPAEAIEFDNPPAAGDFDSWMQAYACVVSHRDDLIMVYNGNDFGRTGFAWARLPGGAKSI